MNKAAILRAIRGERRRTLALLQGLDASAFEIPTALPGWQVREVVAHLITTDRASVLGTILPAAFGGVERLEAWNERHVPKWSGRPVPELLLGLDRWGRRFARLAAAIPAPVYRLPISNTWGPSLGAVLWVRAYDEWVHRQDIRRALQMPDDQVDLDDIAEFILLSTGHLTLRRMGGRRGRILMTLTGATVPEWSIDLGARTSQAIDSSAPDGEPTTVRVSAPATDFIMAAAGRDRFEDLEAKGVVVVEGDRALADEFLSGLLVV